MSVKINKLLKKIGDKSNRHKWPKKCPECGKKTLHRVDDTLSCDNKHCGATWE